jgi:hypothetical protein
MALRTNGIAENSMSWLPVASRHYPSLPIL